MKTYKAIGLTALICIILTSSLWYVFGATPTSTFWISEGIYPSGVDYAIYKVGSTHYSKDVNGQILYSGSNATEIIQDTIDVSSRNDVIFFHSGKYDDLKAITLKSNRSYIGSGYSYVTDTGTVLEAENGFTGNLLSWNGTQPTKERRGYVIIKDLCLSLGASSSGNAIYSNWTMRNIIENVYIRQAQTYGIYFEACEQTRIVNCFFHGCVSADIWLNWCSSIYILNNEFASSETANRGILLSKSENIQIKGNTFYFQKFAIEIYNYANFTTIESCAIWRTRRDAIYLHGANFTHINNVHVFDCGYEGAYRGIYVEDTQNSIFSTINIFNYDTASNQTHGIVEASSSDYNIYSLINTRTVATNGIILVGANSKCNLCWNSTSWIS